MQKRKYQWNVTGNNSSLTVRIGWYCLLAKVDGSQDRVLAGGEFEKQGSGLSTQQEFWRKNFEAVTGRSAPRLE